MLGSSLFDPMMARTISPAVTLLVNTAFAARNARKETTTKNDLFAACYTVMIRFRTRGAYLINLQNLNIY